MRRGSGLPSANFMRSTSGIAGSCQGAPSSISTDGASATPGTSCATSCAVSGVTPSVETISSGEYPVSRPLFFYVKKAHIGVVPGLKEYVEFFVSDQMIGPDSPLAEYGLVSAPDAEREEIRSAVEGGKTM